LRAIATRQRQIHTKFGGTAVALTAVVNTSFSDPTPANDILREPTTFGRWTFHRRGRMITCEIDVSSSRSFDVCIITHWNAALSVVEAYDTPASALSRHEEVVSGLRKSGWVRISETAAGDFADA
jgi:hypothetical protein